MRTLEQKQATKERKAAAHEAHRTKVLAAYPPSVRYAKSKFKKGKKHQPKTRAKLKLGVQ